MDYKNCVLQKLTFDVASEISQWEYKKPYDVYNFKGTPNGYLFDENTWGNEQFCLLNDSIIVGQLACQFDVNDLWVGWALAPNYCGKGSGYLFVECCVLKIREAKNYYKTIYLRVVAWNKRAIKAYQKAGFVYAKTIQDEIAYTNKVEDFYIMTNDTI